MAVHLDLGQLWTPKPTQQKVLDAILDAPPMGIIAYVGSFGSGKTWLLCRAMLGLAIQYPGIEILIGRQHATDLRDTTQRTFFGLIADMHEALLGAGAEFDPERESPVGVYRAADRDYLLKLGPRPSRIMFRSLDNAQEKYKSLNVGAWGIDEASEVPEETPMLFLSRARQVGFPCIGIVVSNPTGKRDWLYRWFVEQGNPGNRLFRTNTLENVENLPKNYITRLREQYRDRPDWIRQYLEGEWGGLGGERPIFPTFDPKCHVKRLLWSDHEIVHVGMDFGFLTPGVVWAQIDKDGRLGVLRTWSPREITVNQFAEGILVRQDEWFPRAHFQYYAGHDARTIKDTSEKTSGQVLADYGMRCQVRYHHRERAFSAIRNLLALRSDGFPSLLVDPGCQTLISGFNGRYVYHPNREEPLKDGIYDPLMDALRQIVINNFTPSGDVPRNLGMIPAFRGRPYLRSVAKRRTSADSYGDDD